MLNKEGRKGRGRRGKWISGGMRKGRTGNGEGREKKMRE